MQHDESGAFQLRRRRRLPGWSAAIGMACVALLASAPVLAQQTSVGGVVVAEQSLRPLAGAQVVVEGTGRGTITDASGRFLLTGLTGPTVTLRVQMIGYRAVTRQAQLGETNLRIALAETAVELDEILVTGTAGGTQRRAIGNVVATVNAADVVEAAPVPNVQSLINARAPGVVIMPGTGMVGSGAKIRIRGASSLSLSNEPLIYVDGVRVDNAQATGPAVQAFGSSVVSRWNDFNPDDIESIEIIKGPAAATLYGTEASNGVIHIITKKGTQGAPVFNLTVRQGANWFANAENRMYVNFWRNPNTGQVESLNLVQAERERGTPIFRTGHLQNYSLNLRGGVPGVTYYLGGEFDSEEGVEPSNWLRRGSGRANVSVFPSDNLDIAASLGYVASRVRLACEAGCGGVTWGSYFSTPEHLNENLDLAANPPRRGYRSWSSEAYWGILEDYQDLGRFTGSIQLHHRPAEWFTHRLTFGTDETREDDQSITERTELLRIWSPTGVGGKTISRRDVSYNTLDYSGTFILPVTPGLTSNTSVGTQYYRRFTKFVTATGTDFALPGLRAINAAAQRNAFETYVENVTVGIFAQQQFGWQDRLFVTAAVRADDNSAFGENFDLVYYPKASATWVVSEEPFWTLPFLNTLRLRAAYGHSGQQPAAFAALRIFGAATAADGTATVTPINLGNPDLGPERGEELEVGFDAGFLDNRLGMEFTFYNARTRDAILDRDAPPSSGFPGRQFVNIGELRNRGYEVMLRGQPVSARNLGVDLTFSLASNTNEVVDLGPFERIVLDAARGAEHRVGYPLGSWFHRRVVQAELDETGRPIRATMLCDDGQGGTVACYTGNTPTAPLIFLGQGIPRYEGAFTTTLTLFDRIRLYGMMDFKTGQKKWDHNEFVRCSFTPVCRDAIIPLEADPVKVAAYDGSQNFGAVYIHDASFLKLREISASYTVPALWANRLGASRATINVAGRNLHTWTRWPGMEPEANYLGGARGGFIQMEQNNLPQLTQFVTTINLSF